MDIDITDIGGSITCLRVFGALSRDGLAGHGLPWEQQGAAHPRHVAVDLSRVAGLSDDAVQVLLEGGLALQARGRVLVLFGASARITEQLRTADARGALALAPDEAAAVDGLFA